MPITRRTSISLLAAGLLSPASGQNAQPSSAQPATGPSIITGPFLQAAAETTVTVTWITDRNTTATVEYGPPNGEVQRAFSSHDGLIDANERIHQVVLRDLKPGTPYRYRAVSREIKNLLPNSVDFGGTVASDFREFRTFDRVKPAFSFLVMNDLHTNPATIPELLKHVAGRPYDFVVLNGDVLAHVAEEEQIRTMLDEATRSFATQTPLVWVRGNHETRGKMSRQLPLYLHFSTGRFYHSFDHGPAHFVVLDAGEDKVDDHAEYSGLADFAAYRREQGEWLKQEVQSPAFRRSKLRVAICHMPFASEKARVRPQTGKPDPFQGMADAFARFGPTLEKAGVDMMISGHMHQAAIIPPEPGHSYPVVQGGGDKGAGRTLIRVEVDEKSIVATVLRADGSIFGVSRVEAKRRQAANF